MNSENQQSDVRFTSPGVDAGNAEGLEEQRKWLAFSRNAEHAKLDAGEMHDLHAIVELIFQNAEDIVDVSAGVISV